MPISSVLRAFIAFFAMEILSNLLLYSLRPKLIIERLSFFLFISIFFMLRIASHQDMALSDASCKFLLLGDMSFMLSRS